eukprot:scpid25483/ scgid31864/ 
MSVPSPDVSWADGSMVVDKRITNHITVSRQLRVEQLRHTGIWSSSTSTSSRSRIGKSSAQTTALHLQNKTRPEASDGGFTGFAGSRIRTLVSGIMSGHVHGYAVIMVARPEADDWHEIESAEPEMQNAFDDTE